MSLSIDEMKGNIWMTLWEYNTQRQQPQCTSFENFSECFDEVVDAMDALGVLYERSLELLEKKEPQGRYAIETTYPQLCSNWAHYIQPNNLVHIWNIVAQQLQFPEGMVNYEIAGRWITVDPKKYYLHYSPRVELPTQQRLPEFLFLQEWYMMYSGYENLLRLRSKRVAERMSAWQARWREHNILRECPTANGMWDYLNSTFPVVVARCTELCETVDWRSNTFQDPHLELEIAKTRVYGHLSIGSVRDRLRLQSFSRDDMHWAIRLLAMEHVGATEAILNYVGLNYALATERKVEMVYGRFGEQNCYMLEVDGRVYNFGHRNNRPAKDMQITHRYDVVERLRADLHRKSNSLHASTLANVHYSVSQFFGIPLEKA